MHFPKRTLQQDTPALAASNVSNKSEQHENALPEGDTPALAASNVSNKSEQNENALPEGDTPALAAKEVSNKSEQNESAPTTNKECQGEKGVNIYSPALSMALALPTLEVEGTNWVKQTELRKYASGAKKKCEEETEPTEKKGSEAKRIREATGSRRAAGSQKAWAKAEDY